MAHFQVFPAPFSHACKYQSASFLTWVTVAQFANSVVGEAPGTLARSRVYERTQSGDLCGRETWAQVRLVLVACARVWGPALVRS